MRRSRVRFLPPAPSYKNKKNDMPVCKNCLTEFKHKKNTFNLYCNNKCQQDLTFRIRYGNWLKGVIEHRSPFLRRCLLERDGDKCSVCKINEWNDKPLKLELEHKDGDSSNNLGYNLCLICPNCHSQTPTYKGANRGHGRHSRRLRYHQGKSY